MIPILVGAAAVGLGALGIKKGLDAKEKNEEAKRIVESAKRRFEEKKYELEGEAEKLRNVLSEYGEFKLMVFKEVIGNFLKLMNECAKNAKSKANIRMYMNESELIKLQEANIKAIELSESLAKGVATGALTAFGVYGAVGTFATASTGTAIASLSGAAATNATLAWLGGGSLAAGGLGIAGGTIVLGSLIAGPAIAMTGFVMDSKAEQNLTRAYEFERDVDEKIEQMDLSIDEYHIIEDYIDESRYVINQLIERYNLILENLLNEKDFIYKKLYNEYLEKKQNLNLLQKFLLLFGIGSLKKPVEPALCQLDNFKELIIIVKSLKEILQAPLIDKEGNRNRKFIEIVEQVKLEYKDE